MPRLQHFKESGRADAAAIHVVDFDINARPLATVRRLNRESAVGPGTVTSRVSRSSTGYQR